MLTAVQPYPSDVEMAKMQYSVGISLPYPLMLNGIGAEAPVVGAAKKIWSDLYKHGTSIADAAQRAKQAESASSWQSWAEENVATIAVAGVAVLGVAYFLGKKRGR